MIQYGIRILQIAYKFNESLQQCFHYGLGFQNSSATKKLKFQNVKGIIILSI